jgi:soluble lytic murein transglycosylase
VVYATCAAILVCASGASLGAGAQTAAPAPSQAQPAATVKPGPTTKTKASATKKGASKTASSSADTASATAAANARMEKQLSDLAHELNAHETSGNEQRLAQFATAHAKGEYGERASLALGHYELDKSHPQEAVTYLDAALKQPFTLSEYALYWHAQALRQSGRNDLALQDLDAFRKKYPESVMADLALQSFAEATIMQGDSSRAEAALNAYPKTTQKPALLMLRAQAREKQNKLVGAAKDYLQIYYGYPLAEEASLSGLRIAELSRQLGDAFPNTPLTQVSARAEALYSSRRWHDAQTDFESVAAQTKGQEQEHAELRIAECRAASSLGPDAYLRISFADADADAERLYSLSQEYRSQKREEEMLDTVKQLQARYPQNHWTEEALFSTGNYYWSSIDRKNAVIYYQQVAANFPDEKNAPLAAWRSLWVDYVARTDDSTTELEAYVQKYPGATNLADALYFLGRAYERAGNIDHARSFYTKDAQRFPETYFGMRSADRLKAIGAGELNPAEFLSAIPDAPQISDLNSPIPPAAEERWERARALRSIAFDASAELELRAAYAATQAPRLMLEAALSAIDAEHYASGIMMARIAYPQPEARKASDVPTMVARALYPLPYQPLVQRASEHNKVDPALVAGIMRQESAFAADAVSNKGAVGLMQMEPKTAPKLAHRQKLRYSRARLFDPEYNLQLGTLYVNDLLKQFGSPEAALAAYNAGEDRCGEWQAERKYDDVAEFVESIPFTETREYVQIVLRNAEMYRWLHANSINTAPVSSHHAADAASVVKSSSKKVTSSRSGG